MSDKCNCGFDHWPLPCKSENPPNERAESSFAAPTGLGEPTLTLTAEEIRHLALFCGMVIVNPTDEEKYDERETRITISPWPEKGVQGDDGMLPSHNHIAHYTEYPEEGCVPLGSPNARSYATGAEESEHNAT